MFTKNKFFLGLALITLIAGLLLALNQSKKPQNAISKASTASTTLSFEPVSTGTNPIRKQTGEAVNLDVIVNPGQNLISLLKIQIKFNPDKLTLLSNDPFTVNSQAFPAIAEGPIVSNDTLSIIVSVGPDGTKAIQSPTKVGTLNLIAKNSTNGTSTLVSFTNLTSALSIGSNDSANQSVLSSTTPASIVISGNGSIITPGLTTQPSVNPTNTQPDANSKSTISFELLLHGVGSAGDNPNPLGSTLSNKAPLNPQRDLEVTILDRNNKPVATTSGAINFDSQSGTFKGSIPFNSTIAENNYIVKIKSSRYLRRRVPEVIQIKYDRDNKIDKISLVAGDTNNDNSLNILDYNAFLDCGYGKLDPLPIEDPNSIFNTNNCQNHQPAEFIDINDDGIINSTDYNLFLRELSVQVGD